MEEQPRHKLPLCRCDPPKPYESNQSKKTNVCQDCGGEIQEKPKMNYLTWRIYAPKGYVRARQLPDGFWEVRDGQRTITLEDGVFKKNYQQAAQTCVINKQTGDYEYHRDTPR